jgi:hypothetical protein
VGIHVAETLGMTEGTYRFRDPDAFLHCDNPNCGAAWLTRAGLVVWSLGDGRPDCSRFTDRLLVACSPVCLEAAKRAYAPRRRWSTPMGAAAFLDALRASVEFDPDVTPIGAFAGAA